MKTGTCKRKKGTLRRNKYFFDYKIETPLRVVLRRGNNAMKKSRARFFAFEKQIYCMSEQRCAVAAHFHITSTN
jgi:hypothetical protein